MGLLRRRSQEEVLEPEGRVKEDWTNAKKKTVERVLSGQAVEPEWLSGKLSGRAGSERSSLSGRAGSERSSGCQTKKTGRRSQEERERAQTFCLRFRAGGFCPN